MSSCVSRAMCSSVVNHWMWCGQPSAWKPAQLAPLKRSSTGSAAGSDGSMWFAHTRPLCALSSKGTVKGEGIAHGVAAGSRQPLRI